MSYRLEQKDIVISGFEDGIADNPYKGIADMRNINITSIEGEASVAFQTIKSSLNTGISGTITSGGPNNYLYFDPATVVGVLQPYMAIQITVTSGLTGITNGGIYYVKIVNMAGGVMTIESRGDLGAVGEPNITLTGTGTFVSIDMAQPRFSATETGNTNGTLVYRYFLIDTNGRVWTYNTTGSTWVFLKNAIDSTSHGNGLACFATTTANGVLFVWRAAQLDYLPLADIYDSSKWVYQYNPLNGSIGADVSNVVGASGDFSHEAMVGQDGILYWCDSNFIQSIKITVGVPYDPTSGSGVSYTWSKQALTLPANDVAQCLGEISTSTYNVLIGGTHNIFYTWDGFSIAATTTSIAENFIHKIISVNTNAYIFAGRRGSIYISNGAQAQLFRKIPDYISEVVEPNFTWGGVAFDRNNLYFGIQATNNAGTAINQYGGLWAINLDTKALRLLNELSYATYAGIASVIIPRQQNYGTNPATGFNLFIGWYSGTSGGVDSYDGTPYQSTQAYIDSDMIPIGTYLEPFTPSQLEWKVSKPLVSGESVALYYRNDLTSSFTLIPTTTSSLVGKVSDLVKANFQKAQWVQIRTILTSTATTPTYTRLTEVRIRNLKER